MLGSYEKLIQEDLEKAPPVNIHILRNIYAENLAGKTKGNDAEFVILCRDNISTKSVFTLRVDNPESMGDEHLPVIIHPPEKEYAPVRKILFATNYHSYDMEVLKNLTGLFDPHKTEITALHITEDLELEKKLKQAGFLKLVRSETHNENIKINTQLNMGKADISNLLRSFAFDMEADLMVVLREEKSFLEKLLRQDVIEKLARESELPLMIFFEPGKEKLTK
jgi:nucleotide-binding universal stress UspA family protein